MTEDNHRITFEVARWDLEVVCYELSASAEWFPLAWSALKDARAMARSLRGQPVEITLTRDSATRLVDWIDDHASPLTAHRFAKEAFSRFLTAITNAERASTRGAGTDDPTPPCTPVPAGPEARDSSAGAPPPASWRRPGKVISVPVTQLSAEAPLCLADVDTIGRLLAVTERQLVRPVLEFYTLDADGPVWVTLPTDVRGCFRFTERPDLEDE